MSNYPAGAKNDSNAPYNQPEPEYIECSHCEGTGRLFGCECDWCKEGYVEKTQEEIQDEKDSAWEDEKE